VRRVRNKSVRSELHTRERKVRAGDTAELKGLQKDLDRAAARGVIHKNKAARKKSRLAKAAKQSS
jgi:small subunit ribosomal protein S20